jgi:predicted nucleic acid-binding Zn ribbon protein
MSKQEEQITEVLRRRSRGPVSEPKSLAECVKKIVDERISLAQAKFGPLVQHWRRILPAELERHCKIQSVSSGQLKISVDSPSCLHELQLCSERLLEELQESCPRARIQKIKFVIG